MPQIFIFRSYFFLFSLLILVFVLGVFWIVVGYGWFLQKQERVANGVARPEFPYTD